MGLRSVTLTNGSIEQRMARREPEDRTSAGIIPGDLYGFFVENNNVVLLDTPSGILNFYYYLRPGDLVPTTRAATLVSADATLQQIVVDAVPSDWAVGTELDVINQNPGFDTRMVSNPITDITGTTITLQNPLPTKPDNSLTVLAGQWVVEAGLSPVPQVPVEFFQYLAEAVTAYIMESQGDQDGYVRAQQRMIKMLEAAQKTISPRVDGSSRKFVPARNRVSTFFRW
jgi:hypothetical protein